MILLRGYNNHTIQGEEDITYIISIDTQGDDVVCMQYQIGEQWVDVGDVDFRTNTFHIVSASVIVRAAVRVYFSEGARMEIVVPLNNGNIK